jgi:hypothetical protein
MIGVLATGMVVVFGLLAAFNIIGAEQIAATSVQNKGALFAHCLDSR